ncbi:MAG: 3-methyl-2-oxobutanoate hydroxymethyltransferase [Acidobacteria bacterium]|nr:3-methyl-2-oxobutanoate hydroxymethyltransferase [Acidobacteriota bacterium]
MSAPAPRVRTTDLLKKKLRGEKITALTAYDASMGRLLDDAGIDWILVGDSAGMVVLGHETTVPVTMDVMLHHTKAVVRGVRRALVVADLPFLSYQISVEEAMRNAARLVQEGGAAAVKLEGSARLAGTVHRIVDAGIPVMGHVGLLPQSVHQTGGYRTHGKTQTEAERIMADAKALEEAGAFALVLECITPGLARDITAALKIPTIGIGSGPHCDGQILVSYDAFGLYSEFVPRFVKQYAQIGAQIAAAARTYANEVRTGQFPAPDA